MADEKFVLNNRIIDALEEVGFSVSEAKQDLDDTVINVALPKMEGSVFNGLIVPVSCTETDIPDAPLSNEAFLSNFISDFFSFNAWETALDVKATELLEDVKPEDRLEFISDIVSTSAMFKEWSDIASHLMIDIQSKEYPNVSIEDIKEFEQSEGLVSELNSVNYRISNAGINFEFTVDNKEIFFDDYSIPFDGTMKGFAEALDKFISNFDPDVEAHRTAEALGLNFGESVFTTAKYEDFKNKLTEDYGAISSEIKVIAKEAVANDVLDKNADKTEREYARVLNEINDILGDFQCTIELSPEVLDAIENSAFTNEGIEPFGTDFRINLRDGNTLNTQKGLIFDGTDEGLKIAVGARKYAATTDVCINNIASGFGISMEEAKDKTIALFENLTKLENSIGNAIESRDLREQLDSIKEHTAGADKETKEQPVKAGKTKVEPEL